MVMMNSKLKIDKNKWLKKLSSGVIESLSNSDELDSLTSEQIATIDKVIEGHLDGVLNEISEFDLVVR